MTRRIDARHGITGTGEIKWVLGILLERDRSAYTISISQEAFVELILARFNLTAAPVMTPRTDYSVDYPMSEEEIEEMRMQPYREIVGAPVWHAFGTRPDIAFASSSLARFGHNPGRVHWEAAKWVLRYLKGTKGWRLTSE